MDVRVPLKKITSWLSAFRKACRRWGPFSWNARRTWVENYRRRERRGKPSKGAIADFSLRLVSYHIRQMKNWKKKVFLFMLPKTPTQSPTYQFQINPACYRKKRSVSTAVPPVDTRITIVWHFLFAVVSVLYTWSSASLSTEKPGFTELRCSDCWSIPGVCGISAKWIAVKHHIIHLHTLQLM